MRWCVIVVVASLLPLPALAAKCDWCGCRGGPGYRMPNGKCAGRRALRRVCGDPPSTRCTFEGGPDGPVLRRPQAAPGQPVQPKQQQERRK